MDFTQLDKIFSGSWCTDEAHCCTLEETPDEVPVIVVKREEDNAPPPESSCGDSRDLQSSDWQIRRDAVARLGLSGRDADGRVEPEVLAALEAAFKDEHWQVRRQSAFALQELGEVAVQEAMPYLRQACTDQDPYVRTAALLVLMMYDEDTPSKVTQQARIMMLEQSNEHEGRLPVFCEHDRAHETLELKACSLEDIALLSRLEGQALSRATDIFVEQEETTWLEGSCTGFSPRDKTSITGETSWLESESPTGLSPRGKTGTQTTEGDIDSLADTEGNTEGKWSQTDTDPEEKSLPHGEKSQAHHSCTERPNKWSNSGVIVRAEGDGTEPIFENSVVFKMSLIKQPGSKLGITLELGPQQSLKVLSVEQGSISKWNQTQPPESQLQPGDRIIAVNGMRGASRRLLEAIQSSGEILEVTFRRKPDVRNEEPETPEFDDLLFEHDDLKVSSVKKRRKPKEIEVSIEAEMQQVDLMQTVVWPRGQGYRSTVQLCAPSLACANKACSVPLLPTVACI